MNRPVASKFTIQSPMANGEIKKSKNLRIKFQDLEYLNESEKEHELNKEERIAIERIRNRKIQEEKRKQHILEKK